VASSFFPPLAQPPLLLGVACSTWNDQIWSQVLEQILFEHAQNINRTVWFQFWLLCNFIQNHPLYRFMIWLEGEHSIGHLLCIVSIVQRSQILCGRSCTSWYLEMICISLPSNRWLPTLVRCSCLWYRLSTNGCCHGRSKIWW
jgi:hypothetical protein